MLNASGVPSLEFGMVAAQPLSTSSQQPVVLLVDDEPIVRMILAEVLQDAGFKVIEAASADEGLRILAVAPDVQVMVTDVEMPGSINGFELACRAHSQCNIGIVVVSGRACPGPGELPKPVQFMAKPFHADTLVRLVRRMVPGG